MKSHKIKNWLLLPVTLFISSPLILCSCASDHPALKNYSQAEIAIQQAERQGVAEGNSLELHLAREHLTKSKKALDENNYDVSVRQSGEALVDAQLAQAKYQREKAEKATEEVRKSMGSLEDEANKD